MDKTCRVSATDLLWCNARLTDGFMAAEEAYLILLQIPHDTKLRLNAQLAMCSLRDFIADTSGRDAESVQNEYEARAALLKAKGEA